MPPDFLVLDLHLPDGSGTEVPQRIRDERLPIKVAVACGHPDLRRTSSEATAGVIGPGGFLFAPLGVRAQTGGDEQRYYSGPAEPALISNSAAGSRAPRRLLLRLQAGACAASGGGQFALGNLAHGRPVPGKSLHECVVGIVPSRELRR